MSLTKTTTPSQVITTAETKDWLRVSHTDEDTLFAELIKVSTRYWELTTRTQLLNATYKLVSTNWENPLNLPIKPVVSISEVNYIDSDGLDQTLATSVYELSADGKMHLKWDESFPSGIRINRFNSVTCNFLAGFGATSTSVPQSIRLALKEHVGQLYANRESSELSSAVYRKQPFAYEAISYLEGNFMETF